MIVDPRSEMNSSAQKALDDISEKAFKALLDFMCPKKYYVTKEEMSLVLLQQEHFELAKLYGEKYPGMNEISHKCDLALGRAALPAQKQGVKQRVEVHTQDRADSEGATSAQPAQMNKRRADVDHPAAPPKKQQEARGAGAGRGAGGALLRGHTRGFPAGGRGRGGSGGYRRF